MIKPFVALALLLMFMVFTVALHFTLFPYAKHTQNLQYITTLTQLSTPSLSVQYDESHYNTTYPDMPTLGRMDFVYEQ